MALETRTPAALPAADEIARALVAAEWSPEVVSLLAEIRAAVTVATRAAEHRPQVGWLATVFDLVEFTRGEPEAPIVGVRGEGDTLEVVLAGLPVPVSMARAIAGVALGRAANRLVHAVDVGAAPREWSEFLAVVVDARREIALSALRDTNEILDRRVRSGR